jgi:hypothetical protein
MGEATKLVGRLNHRMLDDMRRCGLLKWPKSRASSMSLSLTAYGFGTGRPQHAARSRSLPLQIWGARGCFPT